LTNSQECNYRKVFSINDLSSDISTFEEQVDENIKVMELLKNSNKLVMFYKNVTDKVYFLTVHKSGYGSNEANFMLSLLNVDGYQSTYTENYHMQQFEEMQENEAERNSSSNSTEFEHQSYWETIMDMFNLLSTDLDYYYAASILRPNYHMSNILKMGMKENVTLPGEMLIHSFSHNDLIFCVIHVTTSNTYMTYYDLNDFSYSRSSTYQFPDNSLITSVT
jgi:hypothetical protein